MRLWEKIALAFAVGLCAASAWNVFNLIAYH